MAVKRDLSWLKPLWTGVTASALVAILAVGLLQLNERLAVTYWDIQADATIKPQIEKYLTSHVTLDYWHTRASLMQEILKAEIPDIKSIQVSRILPDGLVVQATARKPLALWESREGKTHILLIDEDAVAYRELQHGENLDLPILRLEQAQLQSASVILHQLRQQDVASLANLSEVIVAREQWRLNFAYGEQWQFKQTNIEQDVAQIIKVLAMPQWSKGHWRVDARMPQRWFIRPAKQEVI